MASFYQHDQIGTPNLLTSKSGTVQWQGVVDAFGEMHSTTSTINNSIRFPGQYNDEETGLHYNYFRDYNPVTGRYMQSDPLGIFDGVNTYNYVDGNPVSYVDPSGRFFNLPGAIVGALCAAYNNNGDPCAVLGGFLSGGMGFWLSFVVNQIMAQLCSEEDSIECRLDTGAKTAAGSAAGDKASNKAKSTSKSLQQGALNDAHLASRNTNNSQTTRVAQQRALKRTAIKHGTKASLKGGAAGCLAGMLNNEVL